jgi:hypothetical protein
MWNRSNLKPWHWCSIALILTVCIPFSWFLLAYAGLPRLWSHHEHKHIDRNDALTSYTAQDIPGDPINLRIHGSKDAIVSAYHHAGWSLADPVSLRTGALIGVSVIAGRSYPNAPVSPLFVQDRVQDFAFERDEGASADRRHHVRFWQIGTDDWLAAATFDRGVGLSLFTLQITHHIGPDIDAERSLSSALLQACGAVREPSQSMRLSPGTWHRNGGGDKYHTDGWIAVLRLDRPTC